MKTCCKCKVEKEDNDFSKKSSAGDGLNSACRECHNQYTRAHYKNNKTEYVEKADRNRKKIASEVRAMKEVPCMDCKQSYPYYVMDYDHVRGKKEFHLSSAALKSGRLKMQEEASKCDIVCSNCHRIRTFNRKMLRPCIKG